eukprot:CAMPEP_0175358520 /NCGR_PEP_ID=MMETSP0095-20121207/15040_1 /TAXON_ID=311494 /ORGANISM="Alexandrium monilatum, Strain CCMP3105" /LENGTH=136 /DNA_ID=CAMNT_0016656251 /DNA_START=749 /DNA_END=1159 /DNA_ORIENTATION=-
MALIPYPLAVVYSTGFKDVGRSTLLLVAGPGRHLSELLQLLLEVAGGGGLLVLLGLHLELAGTLCSTGASAIHFGEVHLKESRILVQCAEAGPAGHRRRIVQAEARPRHLQFGESLRLGVLLAALAFASTRDALPH